MHNFTEDDITLVEQTFVAVAKQNPVESQPWGPNVHMLVAPSTRDAARAVLEALDAAGRLVTPSCVPQQHKGVDSCGA